uniref:4Fe-4S dicluster domain-containing protein n=1 Tax=Fundidesulfovibrio putealis TaxID=270496 RepID=A0A7C4AH14_9BACT
MSRIAINEERCKGCLLCTAACPEGILRRSGHINSQGYKVAEADPALAGACTGCTACARVCPDLVIMVWRTVKAGAKEAR